MQKEIAENSLKRRELDTSSQTIDRDTSNFYNFTFFQFLHNTFFLEKWDVECHSVK